MKWNEILQKYTQSFEARKRTVSCIRQPLPPLPLTLCFKRSIRKMNEVPSAGITYREFPAITSQQVLKIGLCSQRIRPIRRNTLNWTYQFLQWKFQDRTYPAAAASISWRFARVNSDRTPEKMSVNTKSIPIITAVVALVKVVAVRAMCHRK